MAPESAPALRGREAEEGCLRELLTQIRSGSSRAVVLCGEAGIGKTALMTWLRETADGFHVLSARGVESDVELAYAGLHELCGPLLDHRAALPPPQRRAMESAFGLRDGAAPERFLVGLAALGLLAAASRQRPVLCLVDDVHWLDSASQDTLFFIARRLSAEPVGMMFALRDPIDNMNGIATMSVTGLSDSAAKQLLIDTFPGRFDHAVADRIVAETRGNPLALLEIPKGLTVADLAGGYYHPDAHPTATTIERHYSRTLHDLPRDTCHLLLLAAAEPVGDPALLYRAMAHLGLKHSALDAAVAAKLIRIAARVEFRHPLLRAAAYRAATPEARREVHAALAATTDANLDPDRRAWHRAAAADAPDEDVARELESAAGRARQRGGTAATAAFLTRAVELTPDAASRGRRALDAAEAHRHIASFDAAGRLLAAAALTPLTNHQRARLTQLQTRLAFSTARTSRSADALADTVVQFAQTAQHAAALDPTLATETSLDALSAAMYVGRHDTIGAMGAIARTLTSPTSHRRATTPAHHLTFALATRITEGPAAAMSAMQNAIATVSNHLRGDDHTTMDWFWRAYPIAHEALVHETWDDHGWAELADHAIRNATINGALTMLPAALISRAGAHIDAGQYPAANALIVEAESIYAAINYTPPKYHRLTLAVWSGDEASATQLVNAAHRDAALRGEGRLSGLAHYATAVLNNGLGRYQVALQAAATAHQYDDLGIHGRVLLELIEAATRADDHPTATEALAHLTERTTASGTEWALGALARSRALLATGPAAEDLYLEAIHRLQQTPLATHLARARLLYGEWLRRRRRPTQAREPLRTALEQFTQIGATAFAERARRELLAAGGKPRSTRPTAGSDLSPQERQIAQLAGTGLTNQEIAAQMFISAHTVEWHLRKVFAKLQIRSRRELRNPPIN
ncbi:AAA family ATPase [Mycolicibacterium sp.]|uniref:helix-turn-helix transcriptional regulator n=1 Tax=Mycolicibacterium sp. TaxID=2320850 RepID=UPI0037C6AD26